MKMHAKYGSLQQQKNPKYIVFRTLGRRFLVASSSLAETHEEERTDLESIFCSMLILLLLLILHFIK